MLEILINISEILSPIFLKILYMSIEGTLIGVVIFTLMKFFDNKLSAKAKCIMWIIPIIFLLIPINRIQINTKQNLIVTEAIDKVELALSNAYDTNYAEKIQDIKEVSTNSKDNKKEYTKKQIFHMIVPILWSSICILGILIFILSNISIHIKISNAQRCRDIRVKKILNICMERLKISKKIGIKFQDFNVSPCIYGILRPKILIPNKFISESDKILENIFMHELSHYKRKDMIANCILLIATSVHWFNPFVHYIFKKIRQDMELATDEIALNKMNKEEKKNYGMTLISLLQVYENQKMSSKILCITDDNKSLERRIRKIKFAKKYKTSILIFVIIAIVCVIIPFIVKPISVANFTEIENIKVAEKIVNENIDTDVESIDKGKIENNQINKLNNQNTNVEVNEDIIQNNSEENNGLVDKIRKIAGNWKPYKAEIDGEEVDLIEIYGTAIKEYGGSLVLKENGTYTELIGAYSEDMIEAMSGTYEIRENIQDKTDGNYTDIMLISNTGDKKMLTYLANERVIIEELGKGIEIYFVMS